MKHCFYCGDDVTDQDYDYIGLRKVHVCGKRECQRACDQAYMEEFEQATREDERRREEQEEQERAERAASRRAQEAQDEEALYYHQQEAAAAHAAEEAYLRGQAEYDAQEPPP